ncbi:MAG: Hpt domain-containing protein [Pseudomonadales bacterium]
MTEAAWINEEALTVLREVMEDEFQAVLDAFYLQAESTWSQVATQLRQPDLNAVSRSAHALKGSALSLGAERLCETLEALESAARAGAMDESKTLHQRADEELKTTLTALRAQLA